MLVNKTILSYTEIRTKKKYAYVLDLDVVQKIYTSASI